MVHLVTVVLLDVFGAGDGQLDIHLVIFLL